MQRITAIVREDRTRKKKTIAIPYLRIKAANNELTISGNTVSGTIPCTVYEPGVLFIETTNFRRVLKATKIKGDFISFQVSNNEFVFEDVTYYFTNLNMVYYSDPENAPKTWPGLPPEDEQIPEYKHPTLFDLE